MKVAPLYHALAGESWADPVLIHTGQHYDFNMSDAFFEDLGLPAPHVHLNVGSGTHAEQTGRVMIAYEKILMEKRPDLTIVAGDVNSTLACTISAAKLSVPVAHLEAGLRSFDRTMPEEINRIVTDVLSDLLWTPSEDADENLLKEGIPKTKIRRVGNIMIDSLEMLRNRIESEHAYIDLSLEDKKYGLVTLHRPSNVDSRESLAKICDTLGRVSEKLGLVFPAHPRTLKNLESFGLIDGLRKKAGILLVEPLSYIRFMNLVFHCRLVVTDSGGIQEETTYLGIPCFTMRNNTERPVTVTKGTNRLCSSSDLESLIRDIVDGRPPVGSVPELWDGKTAGRVVRSIEEFLSV